MLARNHKMFVPLFLTLEAKISYRKDTKTSNIAITENSDTLRRVVIPEVHLLICYPLEAQPRTAVPQVILQRCIFFPHL